MRFRPCIDIHNGQVKQIIGDSLRDEGDAAIDNFVSEHSAGYYAALFQRKNISGGHIVLLNKQDSPQYEATKKQALDALSVWPGGMQLGGGVNADNAEFWLNAGASHVVVTTYAFTDGKINFEHLEALRSAVGAEHVVLDVSCKKKEKNSNHYFIVTDRWQHITDVELNLKTLEMLSAYCDEFLIHAADVEGRQRGIEAGVVEILGEYEGRPMVYAGGVRAAADISRIKLLGRNRLDVTIGSALELFGGSLSLDEVIAACNAGH
ncbi:MAG: phosphoribosylformimino-5-aminoimidazole carboxamide ribotide isomerase [Lachnospiraceae bacterium]|nr:phosphoribosylformimino-5-aminoimidazole carboxamide ribotide isomerase [Lachnospiraceae bacterium]